MLFPSGNTKHNHLKSFQEPAYRSQTPSSRSIHRHFALTQFPHARPYGAEPLRDVTPSTGIIRNLRLQAYGVERN